MRTALGAVLPRGASKKPRRTPAVGTGPLIGCGAAVRMFARGAVADCHCSGGGASSSPLAACHLALNAAASADSASSLGSRSTMLDINLGKCLREAGKSWQEAAQTRRKQRRSEQSECGGATNVGLWWKVDGGLPGGRCRGGFVVPRLTGRRRRWSVRALDWTLLRSVDHLLIAQIAVAIAGYLRPGLFLVQLVCV